VGTLPDLDANETFVVVDGNAVGPVPLREVIRAVHDSEFPRHCLVWWSGAADWQFLDEHPDLVVLLETEVDTGSQLSSSETHNLPVRASAGDEVDDALLDPPTLSGLFSAYAREENGLNGVSPEAAVTAVEAFASARSSLDASGPVEDPLPKATRHNSLAAALSGPAAHTEAATRPATVTMDRVVNVEEVVPSTEMESLSGEESKHDENFQRMVKKSEEHQRRLGWTTRVDELLLSGCIGAVTERGYLAMDLSSSETDHRVLFESEKDSRYVLLALIPLPQVNAAGESVGRHLEIKLSWGQDVTDVDSAFAMVRSLVTDDVVRPGKVRAEIDTATSRVYTSVDLIWAAEDFISADYDVDSDALDDAVAAALHILERRWYKLFIRRR